MEDQLGWTVEFYTDARGNSPVVKFLASLPPQERAKIARVLNLLQEFGPLLGMPHARPVGDLWELRTGAGRLFYFAYTGRRFIILHGYRKQSQKTPKREIETAMRRWADFLEREL
jgi:phage-related protein